ncbi:TIGR02444 family protein [Vreelandella sulfidaeris]
MPDSMTLDSTRLQRLQQVPLWDFALTLYAKPGVEAACLTLQEEAGLDVCELLFHCWLYSCGLEAKPAALAHQREQCCFWQRHVTAVLRRLRRDLKASAAERESVAALRETIKQAELMAERENLQRWQTWVWEASAEEQRVTNISTTISTTPPNAAKWLLKQLFSGKSIFKPDDSFTRQESLLRSIQTLTCQLDPYQGAR